MLLTPPDPHEALLTFVAASLLALVHIFAGHLRAHIGGIPRSGWLSMASGASVAYVFLFLLPELAHSEATLANLFNDSNWLQSDHAYLAALIGLAVFYGLERMTCVSRRKQTPDQPLPGFWVHIGLFVLYNALIGYLLLEQLQEEAVAGLAIYTSAMMLHFLVNDYGLRHHFPRGQSSYGRWLLAASALGGWTLSMLVQVNEAVLAVFLAFIAGAVILNTLKEELPAERESRFSAFLLGAFLYALLLLSI
ncbi:hypothetical protein CAI21_15560 [Alkalilimnicola ehrlichii]|uniref:Zinc/iron permease n=1 Tax=Alkalilimnicola ehrlichii TaxID=351052 RepID=A0A3E0WNX3_9GAMM|nr:hypothetical protein [Alkalilimnicola ehrlichii]RFA26980.1 hypothetical protein CAI21_15560 [Alkalilimnicola ehrlichii]RFA34099.1 hypothetical protein CAL65_15695 [Alkalilimnicola ehrlichii]